MHERRGSLDALGLVLVTAIPLGMTYAMLGYAFTVTFRSSGVFNFGIGQVTIFGALIYISASSVFGTWWGLIAAALANAVLGVVFYFGFLRLPEKMGSGVIEMIMITLGLGLVLQNLVPSLWGYLALPAPDLVHGVSTAGSISIEHQRIALIVVAALVLGAIFLFERTTLMGKALIAVGTDREGAIFSGIDPRAIQAVAWSMSFAITALAGALFTPLASATMASAAGLAVNGFSAALIGGLGNTVGSFIGGLGMGLVAGLAGVYVSAQYANSITFALVILFILIRPAGIVGDIKTALGPRA